MGHTEVLRARMLDMLRTRPETRTQVEMAEEAHNMKKACCMEQQDRVQGRGSAAF